MKLKDALSIKAPYSVFYATFLYTVWFLRGCKPLYYYHDSVEIIIIYNCPDKEAST